MKKPLSDAISKASHEAEKAKALATILEGKALFESYESEPQARVKLAKVVYALMDAIEVVSTNLDAAESILYTEEVL